MTITFDPQVQQELEARAEAAGVAPDVFVRQAVQEKLAAAPVEHVKAKSTKPLWEIFLENAKDIPAEEWEKLPTDGAAEHDHYLYGSPKKYS